MGYKLQVHKSCWGEAIFPLRVTKNFADFGNGKTTQVAINNFWCFYLQEIRKNTQAKTSAGASLCLYWSLRQLDYNADPADEDVGKRTHKSPIDLELFLDF